MLLADETVIRTEGGEACADQCLDLPVGLADEILQALLDDIELAAAPVVTHGQLPRLAGDGFGDDEAMRGFDVWHGM